MVHSVVFQHALPTSRELVGRDQPRLLPDLEADNAKIGIRAVAAVFAAMNLSQPGQVKRADSPTESGFRDMLSRRETGKE